MLHVLRYNIESFSNTIIQKPLMAARWRDLSRLSSIVAYCAYIFSIFVLSYHQSLRGNVFQDKQPKVKQSDKAFLNIGEVTRLETLNIVAFKGSPLTSCLRASVQPLRFPKPWND